MKRRILIMASAFVLVMLVFACYTFFLSYRGEIEGTFEFCFEDGEYQIGIEAQEACCLYNDSAVRMYFDEVSGDFKIKANEYGMYNLCFVINNGDLHKLSSAEIWCEKDLRILVSYFKSNNHDKRKVDIFGNVFRENDEWYIEVTVTDDFGKVTEKQILDFENPQIKVQVGP